MVPSFPLFDYNFILRFAYFLIIIIILENCIATAGPSPHKNHLFRSFLRHLDLIYFYIGTS